MFKINNKDTRTTRLNAIPPDEGLEPATLRLKVWCSTRRSGVFIVNFEHISHLALVFLLLTLNM